MIELNEAEITKKPEISKEFEKFAAQQKNVLLINSDPKVLLLGRDNFTNPFLQNIGYHSRSYYQFGFDNRSFRKSEELQLDYSSNFWSIIQYREQMVELININEDTYYLSYGINDEDIIRVSWQRNSENINDISLLFSYLHFKGIRNNIDENIWQLNIPIAKDSQKHAYYDQEIENEVVLSRSDLQALFINKKGLHVEKNRNSKSKSTYITEFDEETNLIIIKREIEGKLQDTITLAAQVDVQALNQKLGLNDLFTKPFTPDSNADKFWRNIPLIHDMLGYSHIISPDRYNRLRIAAQSSK